MAFFKITSCAPFAASPAKTPRNTVPKFPLPSAPFPISTRTSFGSTPGVRRSVLGALRFAARFSAQYRFASAVCVSMSASSSYVTRSISSVISSHAVSDASSSTMFSYHAFSNAHSSADSNEQLIKISPTWSMPERSALPFSMISVMIAPLFFSVNGSSVRPIGRVSVTVTRCFTSATTLGVSSTSSSSAEPPPNKPLRNARGGVARRAARRGREAGLGAVVCVRGPGDETSRAWNGISRR